MANYFQPYFEDLITHGEELMIEDERSQRSPSELVEERLIALLQRGPLSVSHTRGQSLRPDRSQFHE